MFHVKKMLPEDFEFAVRLTDTEGWNFIEQDFKFMVELEPEGCFVLLANSERIGIVTSISFGKVGWLGNLIIEEKHQKKGAGSLLVRRVIDYLKSKNVKTVGLYSYIDTIPFYEKHGFEYDSDFLVLEGRAFSSPVETSLIEARKEDFQKVIDYDYTYFGASRRKLLEAIFRNQDNLCYLSIEDGQIFGYIMAKVYKGMAEIGPLMCERRRSQTAIDLVKTILNKLEGFEVTFCIPKKESVMLDFLTKFGIRERFRVARMFFKPLSIKDCTYLAESLERG
jgi:GNAT superfamily N-acetyltransferase